MQLDQTRIPIRERSFANLMDLSLRIIREHGPALLVTSVVGAAPFFALNYWLLRDWVPELDAVHWDESVWQYGICMAFLVVWQIPLATALTTLYLGDALFLGEPSWRGIARNFFSRLGQLFWLQVVVRGLFTWMCITWPVLFWSWPYLNEVILLERNPLSKGAGGVSTLSRNNSLHRFKGGLLFSRWMASAWVGVLWVGALWLAIQGTRQLLTGRGTYFDADMLRQWIPLAVWVVISYFGVVRFLSYLDLRIRTEGWEVELRIRAEAARLYRQMV